MRVRGKARLVPYRQPTEEEFQKGARELIHSLREAGLLNAPNPDVAPPAGGQERSVITGTVVHEIGNVLQRLDINLNRVQSALNRLGIPEGEMAQVVRGDQPATEPKNFMDAINRADSFLRGVNALAGDIADRIELFV